MESGGPSGRRATHNNQLTRLAAGSPAPRDFDALFAAVLQELSAVARRLMQNERRNHTLQPTALINEAYLRLFDVPNLPVANRVHFVNLAAHAMRQILVDHARRHNAAKRGGGRQAVTLTGVGVQDLGHTVEILDLNDALEKLEQLDPRAAEVVEKRVFGGLTMEEIATGIGVSRRTVQEDWRFAMLWLRREFAGAGG